MPDYKHISGKGTYDDPKIYEREKTSPTLERINLCNNAEGDERDCTPRAIKGKQHYIALRDHIAFGDYVDLGLGYVMTAITFALSTHGLKAAPTAIGLGMPDSVFTPLNT